MTVPGSAVHISGMNDGYASLAKQILAFGDDVSPRGTRTKELRGCTIVIENPRDGVPLHPSRKANLAIASAEALQLIGGVSYPKLMTNITKNFKMFLDGGVYHGAYGPRLRNQLPFAVDRLHKDKDTRQAVVHIWDAQRDLQSVETMSDIPCTVYFQFFVRDGKLEMHAHMRSNDIWWGFTYDVFQFTQLQLAVANALDLDVGYFVHHANSLHAYERDWAKIEEVEDDIASGVSAEVGSPGQTWLEVAGRARSILAREDLENITVGESWHKVAVGPYSRF